MGRDSSVGIAARYGLDGPGICYKISLLQLITNLNVILYLSTCHIVHISILILFLMFVFPCIVSLYYIKNQQDATLAVLFISHCKITVHVSDAFCVHHQEY